MTPTLVRRIQRADADVIRVLGEHGVATVHEAQGQNGLLHHRLRPIYHSARAAGSAVTVWSDPGDNLMIHAAIELCQPGDVLVVGTSDGPAHGMFGDLLGASSKAYGIGGLVVDGGVRDVAELTEMQFPVWAGAICAQGTTKAIAGSVNVPIVCAGVDVSPGDVIVADIDGVVVVPRARAGEVARLSVERAAKEEQLRARLRNRELFLDIHGLRSRLDDLGVVTKL